jgi:RNA polymerase sigma factor (sigma-70 family)
VQLSTVLPASGFDWRPWLEDQFARHAALVRAVVWRRLGRPRDPDRVEELAAETWVRAVRGVRECRFDPARNFAPWVCAVAANVCREHQRRLAREGPASNVGLDELPDPEEEPRARELIDLHRALADCLARLSEDDRRVYVLRFEQGHSGRTTADALGVPESTYRAKLLPRLLARISRCLASKGFADIPTPFPAQNDLDTQVNAGGENRAMTPNDLECLLAEHVAAAECGLLYDGLTSAERGRVTAEIAGAAREDGPPLLLLRPSKRRLWLRVVLAAAAVVLLGVGMGAWIGVRWSSTHSPDRPGPHSSDRAARQDLPAAFLNGRGRLVPAGDDTRFTVIDAGRGLVRLERGEVYVELPPGEGLTAEVETPAGTATSLGTRFYAHYGSTAPATPVLAVVVLGGTVEVSNSQGRAVGEVGEVVLAEAGTAPERHGDAAHQGGPFVSGLGLVYRPEVQRELAMTDEQKARLQQATPEERLAISDFLRALDALPSDQRAKKSAEFSAARQRAIAEVLDPEQRRRLREIGYQQDGYFAVLRPEVAEALQLDPAQLRGIQVIVREFGEAHQALLTAKDPPADAWQQLERLRQEASARIAARLRAEQNARLQRLTGPPLALPRRLPDPPRPRPVPPIGRPRIGR